MPLPNRETVALQANARARRLNLLSEDYEKNSKVDAAAIRLGLIETAGKDNLTWEQAAQFYLALEALPPAEPDAKDKQRLLDLDHLLAFPREPNRTFFSPRDYRPEAVRKLFDGKAAP